MMLVHDFRASRDVPAEWERHNWERPYSFLSTVAEDVSGATLRAVEHDYLFDKVVSGFDCKRVLSRRSLTRHSSVPFTDAAARIIIRSLYQALLREPSLFACLITQSVGEWPDGYWILDHTPRALIPASSQWEPGDVGRLIQGQGWATGPGMAIVLGIDWDGPRRYGPDHQYAEALAACGRVGHALVLEGLNIGLSSRMTPAVHESTAQRLFDLHQSRDCLYFLRLAHPHVSTR